jgi:hypothetical protein
LSCWGVDSFKVLLLASGQMDRIITIVKNWHDDPCANCKPNSDFKQYLKIEKLLVEDNHNLKNMIFLKNYKLTMTNFVGWSGFTYQGTCATIRQSSIVLHRIRVQFPKFWFGSRSLAF